MAIVVFDNGNVGWQGQLKTALDARRVELQRCAPGLSLDDLDLSAPSGRGGGAGDLALYFWQESDGTAARIPASLQTHLDDGGEVLPVVDTKDAGGLLPAELRRLNAFRQDRFPGSWSTSLADEIVSRLWWSRRIRKVFLSYRRADSAAVAHQLLSALADLGYEVFLDEATLPPGVEFQKEIEWWINDADCVVLLASPGVPSSQYVRDEVDFATRNGIGLVVVAWQPEPSIVGTLFPGAKEIYRLATGDLTGSSSRPDEQTLDPKALGTIVAMIEDRRAYSAWRRLCNLVPHTDAILRRQSGVTVYEGMRLGDFRTEAPGAGAGGTTHHYIRTSPWRPTITTLANIADQVDRWLADGSLPASKRLYRLRCMYSECAPGDRRLTALRAFVENDAAARRYPYEIEPMP